MSVTTALVHALNLLAPALGVALVLGLATAVGVFGRRHAGWAGLRKHGLRHLSLLTGAGALALMVCLWWLGRDGRMMGYGVLILTAAVIQGFLLKIWQR